MSVSPTGSQLVAKLRKDLPPGAEHVIHLNNAGAALQPERVVQAQIDYLRTEATHGGYETAELCKQDLQRPYKSLAKMLNCQPRNIAIVQSATSAWTQNASMKGLDCKLEKAFFGIPFQEGDRILTSVAEYASNYINFLQAVKRHKVEIEVIPDDVEGEIDLAALDEMLGKETRKPALIAITHAPTNSGRVYDAVGVGQLAKQYGVPFLLDACQSAGQMPLDVQKIGCHWMSATSRKYLRGPRGMGFLFASDQAMELFEPAILDLHGAEWSSPNEYSMYSGAVRYEQYEKSFAAQVALGHAIDYAVEIGLEWIWERIQYLASKFRKLLGQMPGVTVHDKGRTLSGLVTFSMEGISAKEIKQALATDHINVHTSSLYFTRTDFERNSLPEVVVRASVHYYNTEEELDSLIAALQNLAK